MRMWNINPALLCRKHLLGEHVEMHMFFGCLDRGKCLNGYVRRGLVELHRVKDRHDALAQELLRRGYAHKSPMIYMYVPVNGSVDYVHSLLELISRCPDCRERIMYARQ